MAKSSLRNIVAWTWLALGTLALAACQTEVYSGLPESEANLMLSTLLERGIETEKVSQGKNGFTITVDKKDLVRSLEILRANGLPRETHQSLGEVFSGQGMISSPVEEQARLAFAISQELANTFSKIDGVITARVHVVLGQHDQASGLTTQPSAAVFLRHNQDSPVENMVAKIKEMSATSIPDLQYDKVSVMLVPVRNEVLLPEPPVQEGAGRDSLWLILAAAGALLALLAAGALLLYKKGWRLKAGQNV